LKHCFYIIASTFLFSHQAYALELQKKKPLLSFSSYIGNSDEVTSRSDRSFATELLTGLHTKASARFEWRGNDGDRFYLIPTLGTSLYSSNKNLDEATFGVFGEYRHNLKTNKAIQLRFRGGLEHSNNLFESKFNRLTLQSTTSVKYNKRQSTQFTLRYRYRDQNDAQTFSGFDQNELMASLRHAWRPNKSKITLITTTLYGDIRRAEAERFSYNEIGARFQTRYIPRENWTITGRLKAYARDYQDTFSSTFSLDRSDRRVTAEIEAKYKLKSGHSIFGSIGWDQNNSNVRIRDFSGLLFKVGYSF